MVQNYLKMIQKPTQEQIQQLKKRSAPINYRSLAIDASGKLVEKEQETFDQLLDKRIIRGYGVLWSSTNDYSERFIKGCFSKSITDMGPGSTSNYKIKFRDRHGKSVSLMATIAEDDIGLYFETKPLDAVQWADDLITQLRSGTLNNFSIGFKYQWDKIEWDDDTDTLMLLEVRLFEISAVDIPSDIDTFAVRSSEEAADGLLDATEEFIERYIPRPAQLEARHLFARYSALIAAEPPEQRRQALRKQNEPPKKLDYSYLIKKISS